MKSIEEGISAASVKQRLNELEEKKIDLEIAIAKETIKQPKLTKEKVVHWISRFKNGDIDDPKYRKYLIDIFVNSVFLYDDKIVVTYNWKDGTKTITLTELENADKKSKTTDLQSAPNDNKKRTIQNNSGGSYLKCPLPPQRKAYCLWTL